MANELTQQQVMDALTEEERWIYRVTQKQTFHDYSSATIKSILESLAAERIEKKEMRAMLRQPHYQFGRRVTDSEGCEWGYCYECEGMERHKPDCALAALLAKHKETNE